MNAFLDLIAKVNGFVNDIVWGLPAIIMILGTGILFTVRTRALQVRKFGLSMNETIVPAVKGLVKKREKSESAGRKGTVSQFEAFATAISGTVGTGNIVGVASAIMTGGPGAVFWMWISAFFGMVTNYAENVLGLYYRKKDEKGGYSGGAFYYIASIPGLRWLGTLAAVFCLFAAVSMSGVQTNKITGTLTSAFGAEGLLWVKLLIGGAVAAVLAVIIIGGIKRIGRVASLLVPFMSLLFILMALIVIGINITAVPRAIGLIFGSIFSFRSAISGFGGYVFAEIIRKGMARGVFSNEAGLGSSVIAHSASATKEPVKQGLWGIFEVFFDTFVICTLTALTILTAYDVTELYGAGAAGVTDAALSMGAFTGNLGVFGTVCFSIILPLFAFTTILAWSYYGEKATEFCFARFGKRVSGIAVLVFKLVYVLLTLLSALIESELVWALSDTANGLMALPNLVGLVLLSGTVVKITKNYFDRKAGLNVPPMLSAYPEQNEEFARELAEEESTVL